MVPGTVDDAVLSVLESKGAVQSGLLKLLNNIQMLGKIL